MTRNYANLPPTTMRRTDRAQEDAWIRAFLRVAPVGVLATAHDGQPYTNANLFAYDEANHCLYLHTAHEGRTRFNVEHNDNVCFTVVEMGRLLPADTAMEFSVEYASVVVSGRAVIVTEQEPALRGLQLLMDKYAPHLKPGDDYLPPTDDDLKYTAVYRIDIDSWSGKKKEVEAGFPGAYRFPGAVMLTSNKTGGRETG